MPAPNIVAVHEPPQDLTDAELTAALAECWDLRAAALRYLPVGFGGYHWSAADADGRPWFVTASRLRHRGPFADLSAAMTAAARLAAAGLEFVVAPRLTADGRAACQIGPGWAVTLFPVAEGTPGRFGDPTTAAGRAEVTGMLAALHGQHPGVGLPVRPLEPASRAVLEQAIKERGTPWRGGPYAEAARALVSAHTAGLQRALAVFGELCADVAADGLPLVLTHGEPHPGNLLRRGDSYLLIDWDTAGLAPPERDLWWIASDGGTEAARYAGLTGREVSPAALALYRLRWDLDDTGLALAEFRGPHQAGQDSEVSWTALGGAVRRLTAQTWRTAGY